MISRDNNLLNISKLCKVADVSRSGFYSWRKNKDKREAKEEKDRNDFELILEAYDKLYCDIDKKGITDDAMVAEKYMNTKVKMTLSEYTNIKATTPEDILITEVFLTGKKIL